MSITSALTSVLEADAIGLVSSVFSTSSWGIYLSAVPVITADTVTAFDLRKGWSISDHPVEDGSFASYNKVYEPFRGTVRFVKGGSLAERELFLAEIEAIADTLVLYEIVTPEAVYDNVNITGFSYRRTAIDGVSMLTVDVTCEEVRVTESTSYSTTESTTSSSTSASQVNGGTVQSTTVESTNLTSTTSSVA